jgi:muramoyltetrapeptide carboxypeptidase
MFDRMTSFTRFTFPKPLRPGSRIGVTGPSGGVVPRLHARLDLVLKHLSERGFEIQEGRCLRNQNKHVSADKHSRARELEAFLLDDRLDAICPPWGGEVLIEILPLLDFERIARARPKWVTSFSDISTLHFALTSHTGIATAQTPNLMDLAPVRAGSKDSLTLGMFDALATETGKSFSQESSTAYLESARLPIDSDPGICFMPDKPSQWKSLQGSRTARFSGRLIGGCLDTISCLTGTPHGQLESFRRAAGRDGIVFHFENCEGSPPAVVRMVQNMRQAGWFEGINGLLIGRSSGPDGSGPDALNYVEALQWALDDVNVPVVYDADLGHRPPQMTIINGALATVEFDDGRGRVTQTLG